MDFQVGVLHSIQGDSVDMDFQVGVLYSIQGNSESE